MGVSSSAMEARQLSEFRKLSPGESNDLEIPTPPENRTLTDRKGFIIFGILMVILLPFLIYTLVKSDYQRINNQVDSCGNICGVKNGKIAGIECSGKDNTDKPYLKIDIRTDESICSDECPPGYVQTDNKKCYGGDDFYGNITETSDDMWAYTFSLWWKFLIIILITTILCSLTLLLLRYCPEVTIWGVFILGLLIAIAISVIFWFLFSTADSLDENKLRYLGLGVISTLFTVILIILFLLFLGKIKLIILLYQEAGKALFAMPLMMILPILTVILQCIVLAFFIVTTTFMMTAANLIKDGNTGYYIYQRNGAMIFAMIFNLFVTIWALQFFAGCQYMILAGSVGQWFFKKNQGMFPIAISFTNTMRFHLGTIAFGSFIIVLFAVIKMLIKSFISNSRLRWLVDCICGNIEAFIKFLSNNAYIETAIYGQSFFRSGKRAANMLITNLGNTLSINSVGDFVLAMTQFILVAVCTAISYAIFMNNSYPWMTTVFSFILNLIIISVVFSVFETIVDTLFICFCEDTDLNDGSASKPYLMTTGFRQFVEKTEQVYKK